MFSTTAMAKVDRLAGPSSPKFDSRLVAYCGTVRYGAGHQLSPSHVVSAQRWECLVENPRTWNGKLVENCILQKQRILTPCQHSPLTASFDPITEPLNLRRLRLETLTWLRGGRKAQTDEKKSKVFSGAPACPDRTADRQRRLKPHASLQAHKWDHGPLSRS